MKLLVSVDPETLLPAPIKKRQCIRLNTETRIRTLFVSKGYRKFPKKEYIRCKLIRGHKRVLREIEASESDPEPLLRNNTYSDSKHYFWPLLVESFLKNRESFLKIIPVDAGPVNVLMKKRNLDTENVKRSFNADFCKEYFENEETRKSYFFYINFLFSDLDPLRLNKRFGFRCCTSATHKQICYYKWLMLKKYCEILILEDIEIEPKLLAPEYYPVPSLCFGGNRLRED